MNLKWNLASLYSGFEDPKLQSDQATLQQLIDQLSELVDKLSTTPASEVAILDFMQKNDRLIDLFEKIYSFPYLIYKADTANTEALKLIEKLQSLMPQLAVIDAKFNLYLKQITDFDQLINSDELSVYRFVLTEAKAKADFLLSAREEELIQKMKNTGSSAWEKLQSSIVSTLTGDFDGTPETITVLRAKAYDPDKEIRKKAYLAEQSAYPKKEKESCAVLNAIKGEVITVSELRGYQSPLDMTLLSARMDKPTLDAMLTAMKEYLPHFRRYLRKKAALLGHKNGLPFYDLFAPVGSVSMRYTYEQAQAFIVKQFNSFSPELGNYAKNAFDKNWIDPFPRDGKVAGAFCMNLHPIKESRILSNFVGSFSDMTTLAHELGHGYHGYCLKDSLAANSNYPMPLAETASIFCETIVFNAALKEASDQEAMVIIENDLMGSTQVIVDIYSRYLFETELFKRRQQGSLSSQELKEIMISAQKEAYGDGLDPEYLHPYMWMNKPHYYFTDSNFYNFPYAFGLLFAKGLYAKYQADPTGFVPTYNQLLFNTGCHDIKQILDQVGIDSHNPDFFRSSLEIIKQSIDQFCD